MKWLQRTDFKRSKIHLVRREIRNKHLQKIVMVNQMFLIDDYIKNIKEWEEKGGIGIHHTSVPKTINDLKRLGFK